MEWMFSETGILIIIGAGVLIGVIGFIAKVVLIGVAVKTALGAQQQHQQFMEHALAEAQRALHSGGGSPAAFSNAIGEATREAAHLDELRRQQSELRIASMKSQAAELGIFIN